MCLIYGDGLIDWHQLTLTREIKHVSEAIEMA